MGRLVIGVHQWIVLCRWPNRRGEPHDTLLDLFVADSRECQPREFMAVAGAGLVWTREQANATFPKSIDTTTELIFMSTTRLASCRA